MKNWITSFKFLLLMTLLTGGIYPALMTGIAQLVFPQKSNGSLILGDHGQVKGSSLMAQEFKDPKYFWPRPSGANYNPMPSGATNLSPTSEILAQQVKERRDHGAVADMLFASASGLDPHISPEAALSQVDRVALARGMPKENIEGKVKEFIEGRQFRLLGEERVNVLLLNLGLDER